MGPKKRLTDVIGLDKVKEIIENNLILELKNPTLFARYKKKGGLAILLYGPPGCGKTLVAEAIAREVHGTVVVARIHELIDMYSENSEKNIHAVFEQAREIHRKTRKPVIFIDEIDSLGMKRDGTDDHQSMRLAVGQLLTEMDGLETIKGLIIIGATNQPWAVDPALKRSGRFGLTIYVPPPGFEQRKKVFEKYLRARPVDKKSIDLDELAKRTMDYSAADIERIVDTALEKPMRRENQTGKRDKLNLQDILEILEDKELGIGTLDEWYANVAREFEREPRDKTRFKPLNNELKEYFDRKRSEEALRDGRMAF